MYTESLHWCSSANTLQMQQFELSNEARRFRVRCMLMSIIMLTRHVYYNELYVPLVIQLWYF